MSLITEQIKQLREYADNRKGEIADICREAAETIEALSEKVRAANMERSTAYYNGGWIPVKERLPERAKIYLVSGGGKVWICQFLDFGEIKGWANDARNPIVEAWRECPEPYREDGE